MGILNKVLHHNEAAPAENDAVEQEPICPHTSLSQHWDKLDDMGNKELATYRCESCSAEFNYEDAKILMEQPPDVLLAVGDAGER